MDIMNRVLALPVVITQQHLDLCSQILNAAVTLPLPKPNTAHVSPFANVAGPEIARSPEKAVPGCYMLHGPEAPNRSYVGQAQHLGNRVKDHAKGHNTNTSAFVSQLGTTGLVDLFIVPKNANLGGLTMIQFLSVFPLEKGRTISLFPFWCYRKLQSSGYTRCSCIARIYYA